MIRCMLCTRVKSQSLSLVFAHHFMLKEGISEVEQNRTRLYDRYRVLVIVSAEFTVVLLCVY